MIDALRAREKEVMAILEKAGYLHARSVLEDFVSRERAVGPMCWRRTVVLDREGEKYMLTVFVKEFEPMKGREVQEIVNELTIFVQLVGPCGREETVAVEPVKKLMNADSLSLQADKHPVGEIVKRINDVIEILEKRGFSELS